MNYFDGMTTPLGRLHIVVSDDAVLHIYFPGEKWKEKFIRNPNHPLIKESKKQLEEYFAGKRRKFELPLEAQGTPFQKSAWKVLTKIPYGKTITYSEEAIRLKNPLAVRAVGSANGRNPLPIIVPCHRIVAKGGGVGGYAGGLHRKSILLRLEQKYFARAS